MSEILHFIYPKEGKNATPSCENTIDTSGFEIVCPCLQIFYWDRDLMVIITLQRPQTLYKETEELPKSNNKTDRTICGNRI